MAQQPSRAWIGPAASGAVRLAAEAGTDVDDLLEHADAASPDLLAEQIVRLEQSAEPAEVAADLAGLLWAECEDVPPIAAILEDPASQAALEAVGEARRQAARRLAAGAPLPELSKRADPASSPGPALSLDAAPSLDQAPSHSPAPSLDPALWLATAPFPDGAPAPDSVPKADAAGSPGWPSSPSRVASPSRAASLGPSKLPPLHEASAAPSAAGRCSATRAFVTATAAAILLFGRRLRRA